MELTVHASPKTRGYLRAWSAPLEGRADHIPLDAPIAASACEVTCATCLPFVNDDQPTPPRIPPQRQPSMAS